MVAQTVLRAGGVCLYNVTLNLSLKLLVESYKAKKAPLSEETAGFKKIALVE